MLRREMTAEENLLWQKLRGSRLNGFHFRRQQIIDGFIADFYCHAAGLVIEVDGYVHQQKIERDQQRDRILILKGLKILHIPNEEINNDIEGVLERITDKLA